VTIDWSEPETIDLATVQLEFTTNYLAYLALTKELIPFLRGRNVETALIYVSSNLGLIPIPARSNYCATKAALHHWILCLRTSLKSTNIKVIEIFPPAVQTELHDERHQPDYGKTGRQMGMPIDEFTEGVS
jgi:short-subunit dehydrogenase involved in D-alanine esterification of teichoic acids